MASTPAVAYDKYYKGKGDVATVMRHDSNTYDAESERTTGTIKKGVPVTAIDEGKYVSKMLVRLKNGDQIRVQSLKVQKPGEAAARTSTSGTFKPGRLGLEDKKYTYQQASDIIVETIDESRWSGAIKCYLTQLFWYTAGYRGDKIDRHGELVTKEDLRRCKRAIKTTTWNNLYKSIQNDFGEVLGPFALYSYGLMDSATYNKIDIPKSCRIWWPEADNEPLLDFGVFLKASDGLREILKFSSKAGKGSTNTVKPDDIIYLLNEPRVGRRKAIEKWTNTPQLKVLEKLAAPNKPTTGPILAVNAIMVGNAALKRKYNWPGDAAAKRFAKTATSNDQSPYVHAQEWAAFSETSKPLSKMMAIKRKNARQITTENIRYASEVILRDECHGPRSPVNMNEIFPDAIRSKVWYIKFHLGDDGVPSGLWLNSGWAIERDEDYRHSANVCFRTQNQLDRQKGRIGIQPAIAKS